jgi:glucokinase
MILAADLGGTKCVMALYQAGTLTSVREHVYKCAEHGSLDEIVADFLREPPSELVAGACFAVAGPIEGRKAKITNLPWTIDADALSRQLGGAPVALLNDLQATALGTLVLAPAQLAILQEGARPEHGTIAVIAPGTGLGEAVLLSDGTTYRALPSEGGHADFAPTTDEEIELLRFLRRRHGGHVSNERILSGNGIGALYDFVRTTAGAEPAWLTAEMSGHDRNAVITEVGLAKRDAACVRALEMFAEILGAEAGNQALRAMATGGVVIGGGIPPRLLPALASGALLARFCDKGRFAAWMKSLSVRVSLEPRAALLGAAHHVASVRTTMSQP